jgi:hypothetical protein
LDYVTVAMAKPDRDASVGTLPGPPVGPHDTALRPWMDEGRGADGGPGKQLDMLTVV